MEIIPEPLLLTLLPPRGPICKPLIPFSIAQGLSENRDCCQGSLSNPDLLAEGETETCEIESAGDTVSFSQSSSSPPLASPAYLKDVDPDPDLSEPENTESLLPANPPSFPPPLSKNEEEEEEEEENGSSSSLNPDHPLPLPPPLLPLSIALNPLLILLPFPSKGAQSHSSLTSSL